jgi:nucleotide-binding universal stress UspA family protein
MDGAYGQENASAGIDLRRPGLEAGCRISCCGGHYQERLESFAAGGAGETRKLLSGKPSLALLREARRGYDLLVMGSRGRGNFAASLLGSTVQEILTRCPVPVLVVGPR